MRLYIVCKMEVFKCDLALQTIPLSKQPYPKLQNEDVT